MLVVAAHGNDWCEVPEEAFFDSSDYLNSDRKCHDDSIYLLEYESSRRRIAHNETTKHISANTEALGSGIATALNDAPSGSTKR